MGLGLMFIGLSMIVLLEKFFDVSWHGYGDMSFVVIPFESHTQHK